MENKPLISVIVPVYNVQKYVRKSVESIYSRLIKILKLYWWMMARQMKVVRFVIC